MDDMNRLGDLILKHWTTHRPELIEELVRTNQLQPVLRQAQEQTGDLLYNLTVVQKMEYHAAWELVMREWAFLPPNLEPPSLDDPERSFLERSPLKPSPLEPKLSGKPTQNQTPSPPAISE
jgi:hypothetical protein